MELKRYLRVVGRTGDDDDDYSIVEISNRRAKEAADLIEKLEEQAHYANGVADLAMKHRDYAEQRVAKLEAALQDMLSKCTWEKRKQWCGSMGCHCQIARKALEDKQ
jgi:hypothetical protein